MMTPLEASFKALEIAKAEADAAEAQGKVVYEIEFEEMWDEYAARILHGESIN